MTLPRFHKTVKLGVPIEYAGQPVKECVVGPFNIDAQTRSLITMPDEIDNDLVDRYVRRETYEALAAEGSEKSQKRLKSDYPDGAPDALLPDETSRAARHLRARIAHTDLCRVVKLGPVPAGDLVAHLRAGLMPGDAAVIAQACREVDAEVDKFREENEAGVDDGDDDGKD